jgi:peptidoglycan lytic transglycosylase G
VTKSGKIAGAIAGLLFLAACSFALEYFWLARTPAFTPPRIVSVEKGEAFRSIARKLADAGVVRSSATLIIYGELTGLANSVKPGDYAFRGNERPSDVMRHLVRGDFMVVAVTIPEGLTLHQIAERLDAAGLACDTDFEHAAREGPLVKALGFGPLGVEGYLFPATYRFSPLAGTHKILATMLARFYENLTPSVEERMFALGLDTRQLLTLASMVEKEAKVPAERPLIAGVFYNRLNLGMPLQSDPTAQYSLEGDASPAAVAVHTPSAFNTYTISGLPPGPIANPGWSSVKAALYPTASDYLYFVARSDGTHIFSRSFKEHERAIAAVRRRAGSTSAADRRERLAAGDAK